jgi:hypothetical protein
MASCSGNPPTFLLKIQESLAREFNECVVRSLTPKGVGEFQPRANALGNDHLNQALTPFLASGK